MRMRGKQVKPSRPVLKKIEVDKELEQFKIPAPLPSPAPCKVGYRRVYDAISCYIPNAEQGYDFTVNYPTHTVICKIGLRPVYPFLVMKHPLRAGVGMDSKVEVTMFHDTKGTDLEGHLLVDVVCWQNDELSEEQAKTAASKLGSPDLPEHKEINRLLNQVCAIVGLKLHGQFFTTLLNEGSIIKQGDQTTPSPITQIAILAKVVIEDVFEKFKTLDVRAFQGSLSTTTIPFWLNKAWSEHDLTLRFLALFIPLEIVMKDGFDPLPAEPDEPSQQIRRLIDAHDADNKGDLLTFFDGLLKPSLNHRFRAMAEEANMPTMNKDVKDFRKFNDFRNRLLHRGQRLGHEIEVKEETVVELQSLTEKYVAWSLNRITPSA